MEEQLILKYLRKVFEKSTVKFLTLNAFRTKYEDCRIMQEGQLYCTPDRHCTYVYGTNIIKELWLQWGKYYESYKPKLLPEDGTKICKIINSHPYLKAPQMMHSANDTIIIYLNEN